MKVKLTLRDLSAITMYKELSDRTRHSFALLFDSAVDEMEDSDYGDVDAFKAEIEILNDWEG